MTLVVVALASRALIQVAVFEYLETLQDEVHQHND